MQGFIYILGITFSSLSSVVTIAIIFLHLWIPKLLKHPGQYVFLQCICQLIYDFHWLVSYSTWKSTSETCELEAILLVTAYNCGLLYVSVLGIELCCKIKHKGSVSYFRRTFVYHTFVIGITSAVDVVILVLGGFGLTAFHTCSVTNPISNYFEYIISSGNFITMIVCLWYLLANRGKSSSKLITNFTFYIFFVLFTWILPSFFTMPGWEFLTITGYFLGTLSGMLIGLSRIINHKLYREVRKKFLKSNEKFQYLMENIQSPKQKTDLNSSLEEIFTAKSNDFSSVNCYGELYDSISVKVGDI